MNAIPELTFEAWRRVLSHTAVTTLIVAVLAVLGTLTGNWLHGQETARVDYFNAVVLAVVFTVPIYGSLAFKLQQVRLLNLKLHDLASTDFLTGALNRGAFVTNVENRLTDGVTCSKTLTSALLVIDVDHFKSINDQFGHQSGDIALVRIADALRDALRTNDLIGRLGGEEFGIFLPDIAPDEAILMAEACRIAVEHCLFAPLGDEETLSVSIGVALARPQDNFTSLFKQADSRLYLAKSHGRNRVEVETSALAA